MLFAAYAGADGGIPVGQLTKELTSRAAIDVAQAADRLAVLGESIEAEEPNPRFARFAEAAGGSTQRISTRSVRYRYYRWALTGEDIISSK